ncbi:MAG: ethanolamine ammonia-lyase subunit EutC [Magnetospirillum sp.]|nr:ethanolamine ammonia-lyase subunit EutC [Magnetospirillum sp.]
MSDVLSPDPWARFRAATHARIGLGRVGDGLPTQALLDFQLAHAKARDAVHGAVDFAALSAGFPDRPVVTVHSAAADRATYLRRPDLGRRLDEAGRASLHPGPYDVAFVIADGLSAAAVGGHAVATVRACLNRLSGWSVAPIVLAAQARVALGDEIGAALGARMVAVLIGERPGLSVADSLGIYLTWEPRPGRRDSERNCISNIHADGLGVERAADRLAGLMAEARRLRLTGIHLKEDAVRLDAPANQGNALVDHQRGQEA